MAAKFQLFHGINELLTLQGAAEKSGRRIGADDLSPVKKAAILAADGKIVWCGEEKKLNSFLKEKNIPRKKIHEKKLSAETVLPGFIDCHNHLVFAGNRRHEFEWRNQGKTYQEIAAEGGGIRSTVRETQKASPRDLLRAAQQRANRLMQQGVTTLEIKSGYGLKEDFEIKILRVAKKIKGPRIIPCYLGPHAVPEGTTADAYIDEIVSSTLPKIRRLKLAERVDMFVEPGYFTLAQAQKYYSAATQLGFHLTCHSEQMTRLGSAQYMSEMGAASADHLVQLNADDIQKMGRSETTAVLLPTSDFYLKMKYPPARELISAGARVALATDFNPGTSPTLDLSFLGVLARLEMKMTLPEVIVGMTLNAAWALNQSPSLGSIAAGKACDFIAIEGQWQDLFYQVGNHPVKSVWRDGQAIY